MAIKIKKKYLVGALGGDFVSNSSSLRLGKAKYELALYENRLLVKVYRTDVESGIGVIEGQANNSIDYYKKLNLDVKYEIKKFY